MRALVQRFRRALPSLVLDLALFKVQLDGAESARESPFPIRWKYISSDEYTTVGLDEPVKLRAGTRPTSTIPRTGRTGRTDRDPAHATPPAQTRCGERQASSADLRDLAAEEPVHGGDQSSLGATRVPFNAIFVSAASGQTMLSEVLHEPGYFPNSVFSSVSFSDVACSAESFSSTRVAFAARTSASRETSSTLISGAGSESCCCASFPNFSASRTIPRTSTGSSPLRSASYFWMASS